MLSDSGVRSLEAWASMLIDETADKKTPCSTFNDHFQGFYSRELLAETHFVIIDRIPTPPLSHTLLHAGKLDFSKVSGLTLGSTYFVRQSESHNLQIHFHELVHVIQWRLLTTHGFLTRYIKEVVEHGYRNAPLEIMAYDLDNRFQQGARPFDVESAVKKYIK